MERHIKKRLLGTIILVLVAVILLSLLFEPPPPSMDTKGFNDSMTAPPRQIDASEQNYPSPEILLDEPEDAEFTPLWVTQVGSFDVEEDAFVAREKIIAMEALNVFISIETEMADDREVYVVKVLSDDYEVLSEITELIKKDYPDAFIKGRE